MLGIGEIGLNKNTKNEVATLEAHRPGVQDQRADALPHAAPGRQVPGHADDPRHAPRRLAASTAAACASTTARSTRSAWRSTKATGPASRSIPTTKATPERAADMVEIYGPERILVNSSADWGPSRPDGRARLHPRHAPPRPPRVADPPGRLRQPAGVLQPEPPLPVCGEKMLKGQCLLMAES